MSKRGLGILVLSSLACVTVAQAQTSSTTGAVRGVVSSKSGGALPGATVLLRNLETGLTRTSVTNAQGEYAIGLLPTGPYEITVTAPTMRTLKDSSIRVLLGKATPANFKMDKAEVGAIVEVVVAADQLDKSTVSNSVSIDQKMVESVPLNGRNFTDLVKLTPGAVTGDQGRQLMEGARGIMNNLTIDGASYNSNFYGEQRGSTSTPFAFGLDTIKELQVITDPFDPMYGNAAGGVINAVTKSGGNEVEGSALAQFRPKSLVALRRAVPFASNSIVNTVQARTRDFEQSQYNFNVGGPIIKDKLFYFVGVETYHYTQASTPFFGATGTSSNGTVARDAFIQNFGNLIMAGDGHTLASESGMPVTQDKKNTTVFARIDWNINENHRFDFRVNSQQFTNKNGSIPQSTSTGISANGTDKYNDISWVLELNSTIGSNMTNEARLQFATERRPRTPNSTTSPEFVIASNMFTSGQIWYEPSNLNEFTKQFIDTFTFMKDAWTLKAGIDFQWFRFQNQFPQYMSGYFQFDSYATANAWATGTAFPTGASVSYKGAVSPTNGWIDYTSSLFTGFLSASYSGLLNNRLNLTGGFRITKENAAKNPMPLAQLVGTDSPDSTTAVDPRIAFTLDVLGDGSTLLKGGYGWFSSPNPSLTVSNTMTANGNTIKVYTITQSSNPTAWFGTGVLSHGNIVQDNSLTALSASQLLGLATTAPVLTGQIWDPDNKLARAKRASLGLERKLPKGFVVGVRAEYATFENEQLFKNINLWQKNADGTINPAGYYNDGYPTSLNSFSNKGGTGVSASRPGFAIIRGKMVDLSGFGDVFLSSNTGTGNYKSLVFTASRASQDGFGFQGSLSFARQRDMNSNERVTNNGGGGGSVTNNPADPAANMASGDSDVNFRGVFAGYAPLGWGIKGVAVITYQTGLPYSPIDFRDNNTDGVKNDYALGYGGRNSLRQPCSRTFDLRFSREFPITGRVSLDASIDIYNVLNWANWSTSQTQPLQATSSSDLTPVANPNFGKLDVADANTREVQFGLRLKF